MINCILVDDEKGVLDRMEALLSHFPEVKILAKETVPEFAVETIVKLRPELVFTDVEMPRMTGFDLIEEVRRRKCNPAFVFVTGYDHYAIKAIKQAAFDYLVKPVDINELREALKRLMNIELKPVDTISNTKFDSPSFTKREIEIIKLLLQGKTSKQIASDLFISRSTVDTHRKHILEKANVQSTPELITLAIRENWI